MDNRHTDPTVDIICLQSLRQLLKTPTVLESIQESEPLMIQHASVDCADHMQSTGFTLVLSESMSTADSEEPGSLTHDRREPSEEPASLTHDRREPSEEPASLTHGISIICWASYK
ncbi:hypothetical protein DPMN_057349 [Dreissena polymorpha]|uniref:Uncharacterized protein n=2 Tax=Dreissena polymorpha TaxID=45954 RepID=A0A9D4BZX8_DREPO|nr:hypothetical protein DPMN_057349 [Dreissena polymorpha]